MCVSLFQDRKQICIFKSWLILVFQSLDIGLQLWCSIVAYMLT
jgi:hypothetical protein